MPNSYENQHEFGAVTGFNTRVVAAASIQSTWFYCVEVYAEYQITGPLRRFKAAGNEMDSGWA